MTSQILRESYRWRKTPFGDPAEAQEVMIRVRARSLGWNRSADFPVMVVPYDLRMSLETGLVDRRGVRSPQLLPNYPSQRRVELFSNHGCDREQR
jgi:hypothetical protein